MAGETGAEGLEAGGARTLAARLGHPPHSKLLIVHADDFGEWQAVNAATKSALESGSVNSASLMVPCPWFPEAAAYARAHPEADLGLHLTLTSERTAYRWGPINRRTAAPTLLDKEGYFHRSPSAFPPQLDVREVEAEVRAQIEHALAAGVRPTHLDSHQGALYSTKALFGVLLELGGEYGIPVMVSRRNGQGGDWLGAGDLPAHAVLVNRISISPGLPPDQWADYYLRALKAIPPGLTQMVVHLAYANDETRAGTAERETWGASWRERDFDFVTSDAFRQVLREQDIKLVTWREVGRALGVKPGKVSHPGR